MSMVHFVHGICCSYYNSKYVTSANLGDGLETMKGSTSFKKTVYSRSII